MSMLTWLHIAGGSLAILSGAVAVAAPKGRPLHARAGTWFFASMLVLGITAAILAWLNGDEGLGMGGILTCYFVATSWVTARRRAGTTGRFESLACAAALVMAATIAWVGIAGAATPPPGRGPLFALAAMCLLAGLLDLYAILRAKLTPAQRISRHLWRMCFAFFMATGSFFMGQQDLMPQSLRGSPILIVLGLAPLAVMVFWLVRLRFSNAMAQWRQALV